MIRATFARVGAYGIPADNLTAFGGRPHGATVRLLRQVIMYTIRYGK